LQVRFPHAVHVEWQPAGGRAAEARFTVRGRSDDEIACCFVDECRGEEPNERERKLLSEAFAAGAREAQ
jgi:exonuclease SbcD